MPNLPNDPCVDKMVASGEGNVSREEMQQLHDQIRDQLKSAKPEDIADLAEGWKKQATQLFDEQGKMAQRSYLDAKLREERLSEVQSRPTDEEKLKWISGKIEAGVKNSEINQTKAQRSFDNSLSAKIDPILLNRIKNGSMDSDIANYLKSGKNSDALANIKEPEVKKAIQDYAKTLDEVKSPLILDNNNRGALIADKPDYVARQTHNAFKLQKADPEQWYKDFSNTFDLNETYPGLTPEQQKANAMKFRGEVITGRHTGADEVSEQMAAMTHVDPFKRFMAGGGPLVRQSQARTFEPISAQAQLDYMKQYGRGNGTLYDNHVELLKSLARSSAQAQVWGSNPIKNFETFRNKFLDENSTNKTIQDRMAKGGQLDNMWKLASGQLTAPPGTGTLVNNLRSKVFQTVQSEQRMAKLGSAEFTHMPAAVVGPKLELYRSGIPLSEQNWNVLHGTLKIANDWAQINFIKPIQNLMGMAERGEISSDAHKEMLATLLASSQPSSAYRFEPGALGFAGKTLNAIEDRFTKLTARESIINSPREQFVNTFTQHLGLLRDKSFEELPQGIQDRLSRYDIRPDEWEGLRKVISTNELGDHQLNHFTDVPNIEGMTANEKTSLVAKFNHLLGEGMDRSSFTPSTFERAFAYGGSHSQSLSRQLRQAFWQFRTPALKVANTLFGEATTTGQNITRAIATVAAADASLVMLHMAGNTLRQAINGKDIAPWDKWSTWASAITRAEGFGFYGTMLDKTIEPSSKPRNVADFAGSLAGNDAGELIKAGQNLIDLRSDKPDQQLRGEHGFVDQARINTPFHSVPGIGAAMDTYFWNQIHDYIQPGWSERRDIRNQQYQKRQLLNYSK